MSLRVIALARDRGDFGSPLAPSIRGSTAAPKTGVRGYSHPETSDRHEPCWAVARHGRKGDFGSPLELFDRGRRGPETREDRTRFVRGGRRTDAPSFGGMTKKDDRDSPFSYRPPAGKGAELRAELKAKGISFNALVTSLIFGRPLPRGARTPPAEKQMLAEFLARSGAIRDALDEALRIDGANPDTAQAVRAATAELEIIAAGILKMMERGR